MNVTNSSGLDSPGGLSLTLEMLSKRRIQIYIPSIIYTLILLIIGVPGNATVFYIYFTRWKRSSTRVFIIALAACDFINCSLTFPFELANMFNPFAFDFPVLCKVFRFVTYTCNSVGALLLIAIAVDRHTRICKPYDSPMNSRTAKLISIVIVVTSVLVCWPSLVIYGIESRTITPTVVIKFCLIEDQYKNTSYPLAYLLVQCACTLVIFSILTIIYSFIGTQVCRRWKFRTTSIKSVCDADDELVPEITTNGVKDEHVWKEDDDDEYVETFKETSCSVVQEQNPPKEIEEPKPVRVPLVSSSATLQKIRKKTLDSRAIRIGKTTVMLFVVTIAYILCFSPFLVLASHRSVYPERWSKLSDSGEIAYHFFLRSYLANCAINPIIYSFFNQMFRRECIKFYRKLLSPRLTCSCCRQ